MTVSSQNSRIEQLGDGTTTAFAVNFYFLENSDLKVFVNGGLQTITTNYTVTGAGNPAGGTVTFVSAPANGVQVVIFRDPAVTQGFDYIDNDPFPAESHERGLDKLTMIAQRVKDLVSRALRLGDSVVGVNTELPALSGGQLLGTNLGGTGFQLYPLGSEPDTAANIVYTPAGTGAVATTVEDILDAQLMTDYVALRAYTGLAKTVRITGLLTTAQPQGIAGFFQYDETDITSADNGGTIIVGADGRRWKRVFSGDVNVKWFGALGNDINNDTAAIQAAISYVETLPNGGVVFIPKGTYRIFPENATPGYSLLITNSNITIRGEGPGKTVLNAFSVGGVVPTSAGTFSRGFVIFILGPDVGTLVENVIVEDLEINGNAVILGNSSVSSGTGVGWDTSHKGIHLGADRPRENITVRNCDIHNILGECIYGGGSLIGEVIVENCVVYQTNSSAVSVSCSMKMSGCHVYGAANGCIENYMIGAQKSSIYTRNFLQPQRGIPAQGKYCALIFNKTASSTVFENNVCEGGTAASFFADATIFNTQISNNTFYNPPSAVVSFNINPSVGLGVTTAECKNVVVSNNSINCETIVPQRIFQVTKASASAEIDNLHFIGNVFNASGAAAALATTSTRFFACLGNSTGLGEITIKENIAFSVRRSFENEGGAQTFYPRPLWLNNSITAAETTAATSVVVTVDGEEFVPATDTFVVTTNLGTSPTFNLTNFGTGLNGHELTIVRGGGNAVVMPVAAWNSLTAPLTLIQNRQYVFKRTSNRLRLMYFFD